MSRPIGMATPTVEELEAEVEHLKEVIDRVARIRLDLESENRRQRSALERIAGYEVLDPMGYQGEDAYAMADIAREGLGVKEA